MLAFLGLVSVACIMVVTFVITSSAAIGFGEILIIALFSAVGLASIIVFSSYCIARYTAYKVKQRVKNVTSRIGRFKRVSE